MARNSEPLYLKLSDTLAEQIMDGTLPEGTLLPSERELCQTHGISRTTVRQALQDLSQKGYIKAIHGKGTVVVRPQIRQELRSIYSFDESQDLSTPSPLKGGEPINPLVDLLPASKCFRSSFLKSTLLQHYNYSLFLN